MWQAIPNIAIAWAFLAAGVVGLVRRPGNRLGWLMLLVSFGLLARKLQYSGSSAVFTLGFALGLSYLPAFGHAVLAYPGGRVRGRLERRLVFAAYAAALALPLAMLLFYDPARSCLFNCSSPDRVRPHSLLLVYGNETFFDAFDLASGIVLYGLFAVAFIGLILRKLALATPRGRRLLFPLALAGVAAGLRAISQLVFVFVGRSTVTGEVLFAFEQGVQLAVPAALLFGLLRARLVRASVADLVRDLEQTPPSEVETAIARALRDRTVRVGFWVPERRAYVDSEGKAFELPAGGDSRRSVTELTQDGEPIAVLLHDPALREQEESLLDAVCAAARLALGNARLHAELRAQLVKVRESRARIVAAADAERLRIERDLHDGAQQRLVAIALDLRVAQQTLTGAGPEVRKVLDDAVENLQAAIDELRELARGVHPAILSDEGLGAALRSLVGRAPVPVKIVTVPEGRLPQEIESAAYFVACEALTNVVKHASAGTVTIRAQQENGALVIEVADDGVGGADETKGSGLRGLADRVESYGGRLQVESTQGGGTLVRGELPCGS